MPRARRRARRGVAVTVLVLLAVGCTLPGRQALPTRSNQHDRAVEALEQRAAQEEGWVVVELPNLHEGGGTTTWWLHPCDPARDAHRTVVRTAYHGSDVMGLPGNHVVEEDTLPCEPPARHVDLEDGRRLDLDVEVVRLGSTIALLDERETVRLVDREHDTTLTVERGAGSGTHGPCDGRTAWMARLESPRELAVWAESCLGTLAGLPGPARDLLDVAPDPEAARRTRAPLPEEGVEDLGTVLEAAGWESDTIVAHTFEGTRLEPVWYGPCLPDHESDGRVRAEADWHDGWVTVRSRPCP